MEAIRVDEIFREFQGLRDRAGEGEGCQEGGEVALCGRSAERAWER